MNNSRSPKGKEETKMTQTAMTIDEAKILWKQYNPEYYTWMHVGADNENHLRALGHAHWEGFKTALQITGQLEVQK
jgi:hypothetical protein